MSQLFLMIWSCLILLTPNTQIMSSSKKVLTTIAPPPPHFVGDGFRVHSFISPGGSPVRARDMNPIIMFDYNSRYYFEPSAQKRGVGVHPHRGFETVTIAYEGEVSHHDSSGGGGTIGTGDVQWMTAASGVLHKEYHSEEFTKKGGYFQMVQLWVNLPAKDKMSTPKYQGISKEQMTHVPVGSSEVEIIAGQFGEAQGPASTFSPVHLSNAYLKGDAVTYEFPENFRIGVLAVRGNATVEGAVLKQDHMAILSENGTSFTVDADEDATLLVFGGVDLKEPIASYGPFVMNSTEELQQAFEDFNNGKFGELAD